VFVALAGGVLSSAPGRALPRNGHGGVDLVDVSSTCSSERQEVVVVTLDEAYRIALAYTSDRDRAKLLAKRIQRDPALVEQMRSGRGAYHLSKQQRGGNKETGMDSYTKRKIDAELKQMGEEVFEHRQLAEQLNDLTNVLPSHGRFSFSEGINTQLRRILLADSIDRKALLNVLATIRDEGMTDLAAPTPEEAHGFDPASVQLGECAERVARKRNRRGRARRGTNREKSIGPGRNSV